jgi:hypothetical protein
MGRADGRRGATSVYVALSEIYVAALEGLLDGLAMPEPLAVDADPLIRTTGDR